MRSREYAGNLSENERTWSAVIGTALPLLVLRRGSPILSTLAVAVGVGLIARAATGHCAVKAAIANAGASSGAHSGGQRGSASGRNRSASAAEPLDAEDSVEEYAEPVAVLDGLAPGEVASSSSGAGGTR